MTLKEMIEALENKHNCGSYDYELFCGMGVLEASTAGVDQQHWVKLIGDGTVVRIIAMYEDGDVLVAYDTDGDYDRFGIDQLEEL